jgi:hypothetical protein
MYPITVCVERISPDMHQLAGVLGGICSEERLIDGGYELKFEFSLESYARQFHVSTFLFAETIAAMRSPDVIQKAIAESRLCDCGFTTKHSCARQCQGLIDQEEDLRREFPTLDQLPITP